MSAEPRPDPALRPPSSPPRSIDAVAARVAHDLWGAVARERYRVALAVVAAALVAFAHVARIGTVAARATAFVLLGAAIVAPPIVEVVARRRRRDPRAVLRSAAFALGRAEVSRALDHAALAERIERSVDHEGVSPALARLHAARALARLDLSRLADFGDRWARLARLSALLFVVGAVAALALAPARFVEGVDVALARKGVAPLPLQWLDDVEITVHPPSYLHKNDSRYHGYGTFSAHHGAMLVVRGTPRRTGRTLVLADDVHEVPFLDDGSGGVVARLPVTVSTRLRVRARFGAVVVEEPGGWDVVAIQDQAPRVTLEGAPGTLEIAKAEGVIPLRYDAWDDHGLREVHLVIRVGQREERRVLAKLDGDPKHDRGGYVLRTSDPILQKARTPVRVRVEARDNDPITGPKWGRSAELTLLPPVIGAAEAKRYAAVRDERDRLVDLLAKALAESKPNGASIAAFAKAFEDEEDAIEKLLSQSHDGLRINSRLALFLRARTNKVRKALAAAKKTPDAKTWGEAVTWLERLVLAVDEGLRAMGTRDARSIAKVLADVADDGADGVRELGQAPQDKLVEAKSRVETDIGALDGGGASLRALGELGRDLGEIVENDLRRVARARAANNLFHAELALRDLAMRLRDPVPSFGGGGSGGSPGSPGDPTDDDDGMGEESEGEMNAGDQQKKLEELAKEHGGAIGEVEDHLRAAEDPKQLEGLEEEAKRRAKKLREAVKSFPKVSGLRKTFEAAESAAREKVEGMADALEKLQLGDARERGESSLKALEEAREKAWIAPGADEQIDDAATEVRKQLDWIDDLLKKLRKAAAEKAKEKVKGVSPREKKLQQSAEELGQKAEKQGTLPAPVKELLEEAAKKMKDAAEKLDKGQGDEALEAQKEAQKLLEKAREQAQKGGAEEDEPGGEKDGHKVDPDAKLDIPKAEDHKGPEEFRKRVLKGLSGGASSPRLQDAIKRYAEGLVK